MGNNAEGFEDPSSGVRSAIEKAGKAAVTLTVNVKRAGKVITEVITGAATAVGDFVYVKVGKRTKTIDIDNSESVQ